MALLKRFAAVNIGLLAFASGVFAASDAAVEPGQPAPALSVKKWYKGTPVTKFAADKTYVVEFWATWCGPCRESIPHLTEVAKKNPDVTFVGVSIWEDEEGDNIAKFVKEMGDKMSYDVGYSGNQDGMAKTWMAAAGQNGIPTAFIVKGGNIQWVGHPLSIDKPLEEVKAGTFDVQGFKTKFDEEANKNRKQIALQAEIKAIMDLYDAGSRDEAKQKLTAFMQKNPTLTRSEETIRFQWLAKDDPTAWEKKAEDFAASKDEAKRRLLLSFALRQAGAKGDLAVGRKAITLAMKATENKDMTVLAYAKAFYTEAKDYRAALDTVNQMLAAIPASPSKDEFELRTEMQKSKKELEQKISLEASH